MRGERGGGERTAREKRGKEEGLISRVKLLLCGTRAGEIT